MRFDIPQNVPFGTSISAKDLAAAVGLSEDVLTRSVRYAIGNGIFCEPTAGYFAHSASSAVLAHDEHLKNIALTGTHELSYILLKLADTLKLQQAKDAEGPQAAFNVAYPEYDNVFEFLSKNPASAGRYHLYMVGRAHTSRWSMRHLQTAWDWASVGSKTMLDVLCMLAIFQALVLTKTGWWFFWPHMPSTCSRLSARQICDSGCRPCCTRSRAQSHRS